MSKNDEGPLPADWGGGEKSTFFQKEPDNKQSAEGTAASIVEQGKSSPA